MRMLKSHSLLLRVAQSCCRQYLSLLLPAIVEGRRYCLIPSERLLKVVVIQMDPYLASSRTTQPAPTPALRSNTLLLDVPPKKNVLDDGLQSTT
jgi:hypothetical protein